MPIPIPLLLLAATAITLKALSSKEEEEEEEKEEDEPSPSGGNCPDVTPAASSRSQESRNETLASHVGDANLAPGRVLYWDGGEATVGTIQLIWKSDGPWAPCEKPTYSMRSIALAEAPLAQKDIIVDLGQMLGPSPWGKGHIDDELMLQQAWWGQDSFPNQGNRFPRDIVYLNGWGIESKDHNPKRRSWIEAQVSVSDGVWVTGSVTEPISLRRGQLKTSGNGQGPAPRTSAKTAPVLPTAIYGAMKDKETASPYHSELKRADDWQISGPTALVLLRPNAEGKRIALSLFNEIYIDHIMILDSHNSDILFTGKDWLTKEKVMGALQDEEYLAILEEHSPGDHPRPVSVLLWLVFQEANREANPDYQWAPGPADVPLPGSMDYLNAIGNDKWEVWVQLDEAKPGWEDFRLRYMPEVENIMEYEGASVF